MLWPPLNGSNSSSKNVTRRITQQTQQTHTHTRKRHEIVGRRACSRFTWRPACADRSSEVPAAVAAAAAFISDLIHRSRATRVAMCTQVQAHSVAVAGGQPPAAAAAVFLVHRHHPAKSHGTEQRDWRRAAKRAGDKEQEQEKRGREPGE